MMHRELVKHKFTTDKNAVNMFKRCKDKRQSNATVQQSTSVPLTQHYTHDIWDDEEGIMI